MLPRHNDAFCVLFGGDDVCVAVRACILIEGESLLLRPRCVQSCLAGSVTSTYHLSGKKANKWCSSHGWQGVRRFKKTCFSAISTLLTSSAGNHHRPEWPFSFTELSKGLLLLLWDPCTRRVQKSPLNVWLSHRNSLLNGISVMDSC